MFTGCKDDVTSPIIPNIQDTTKILPGPNSILYTEWIYHKDTPNHINDKPFGVLTFRNGTRVRLEGCGIGGCIQKQFRYTYINPKIYLNSFDINLEGSISGNIMKLYDTDNPDRKYLFVQIN